MSDKKKTAKVLLAAALKEKMCHKPLDKITVREITEECGVSRPSEAASAADNAAVISVNDCAMRYAVPLIIAFLIAAPIGYGISLQWLQQFAAHAPIHWWIFPMAFGIVSTVVLLTVIVQCWRVATTNPVESIRTE